MSKSGKGKAHAWLIEHQSHSGDDCLSWPFSRTRGYGMFRHLGGRFYAHRYMCELIHGPAPSPSHECAHSCGNGHLGCTNPRHLSWKTKSENGTDRHRHNPPDYKTRYKLTDEIAAEIRALKGGAETQREIAARYGVSEPTIRDVWLGRTFSNRRKPYKPWTPEDDALAARAVELGLSDREASALLKRSMSSICHRRKLIMEEQHR